MCGIVGAVAQRNVTPILLEGLRRLEYRGYDSAGIAVIDENTALDRVRVLGKVGALEAALADRPLKGTTGIAHTRWATHGQPSVSNAHPHISRDETGVVHNGIIENHDALRQAQRKAGYVFDSDTDTEVIANQIHAHSAGGADLLQAVSRTVVELQGAYALVVISRRERGRLVVARAGSPLLIGIGIGEFFVASDMFALLPVTQRFIILEEGDIADITEQGVSIIDRDGRCVDRPVIVSAMRAEAAEKADYRHYMLKEIHDQPEAIAETLEGRISNHRLAVMSFGMAAEGLLDQIKAIHIVACGTSYHAGLVARYWFENLTRIACSVDIASEYRYRHTLVDADTLFVCISQSGETLDTLEALRLARTKGYRSTLAICNAPESALTREAELVFLTRAGKEIGVASTKAFTTQLVALLMLVIISARRFGLTAAQEAEFIMQLEKLPALINTLFERRREIASMAEEFVHKQHVLYLGRGTMLPVAMEGALKLKEVSYIHAEAYAAGELKHGPLALVDEDMPVVAVAPGNQLIEKLKSNLHEVKARGGVLYLYSDQAIGFEEDAQVKLIPMPKINDYLAPIVYTIPLQLFAYEVAVLKGLDVDQPRNLAKSVTVE